LLRRSESCGPFCKEVPQALRVRESPANQLSRFDARCLAAALLLMMSLVVALFFRGPTVNLLVLSLAAAAWLAALSCLGPNGLSEALGWNRTGLLLALSAIGYLIVAYRFSISPGNAFAPSWVLAAAPVTFICGSALVPHRAATHVLEVLVTALVVGLAGLSAYRFVVFGERAHQPLVDPNNYAALMYLVWIPLVHRHLSRGWRDLSESPLQQSLVFLSSFALVLALMATRSRTSLIVVGTAIAVWLGLILIKQLSARRLLSHAAIVALAWAVSVAVVSWADAPVKGLGFVGGLSVRGELLRSAFTIFGKYPLGVGVFCFPLLYPSVRSPLEQDTAGLFVHNDYAQFLVEGGVPLLAFLVVFVVLVVRRAVVLTRLDPRAEQFGSLGAALALMAVCAHASVNFVFYSLPLGIVIGQLAARLFSPLNAPLAPPAPRAPNIHAPAWWSVITMGWVMWLYLALDVASAGVFQSQPSPGFVSSIRGDDQRMLRFARFAQRMNGERGVPALGEALLLYRATRSEPTSRYLWRQTYEQFHHAIAADPWNALSYVRFAQFLDEFPPAGERAPGESVEELLTAAIGLDRLFVPALDQLLQYYASTSQQAKAYALLRRVVYPWMPRLRRNDSAACGRYFDLLETFAVANGDATFLEELRERRRTVMSIAPRQQDAPWLF